MNPTHFNIQNIDISTTKIQHALTVIENTMDNNKPGCICVTNARNTHLDNHIEKYCHIQNSSLLTVPYGMSLI